VKKRLFLTILAVSSLWVVGSFEAKGDTGSGQWPMAVAGLPMLQHSSGDLAGYYYTAEGGDAETWAANLGKVTPPPGLGSRYICPASEQAGNPPNDKPNYGPFVGDKGHHRIPL